DMQLITVRCSAVEQARFEACRVDDQRVAVPAPARMTGATRLDAVRVLVDIQMNRALDAKPAVPNRDGVAALDDTVDHLARVRSDMQLITVRCSAVEQARFEACRVDDQRVAVPAPERMTGATRLDAVGVLADIHMNRALDAKPAVLNRDGVAALDDTVDHLARV